MQGQVHEPSRSDQHHCRHGTGQCRGGGVGTGRRSVRLKGVLGSAGGAEGTVEGETILCGAGLLGWGPAGKQCKDDAREKGEQPQCCFFLSSPSLNPPPPPIPSPHPPHQVLASAEVVSLCRTLALNPPPPIPARCWPRPRSSPAVLPARCMPPHWPHPWAPSSSRACRSRWRSSQSSGWS